MYLSLYIFIYWLRRQAKREAEMAEAARLRKEEETRKREADLMEAERQREQILRDAEAQERLIAERIAKAKRDCERRIRLLKKMDSEAKHG